MSDGKWKNEIKNISDTILVPLHKVVCEQTNCMGQGFDENNCGACAACADTAENVVGEFIRLTKANPPKDA